MIESDIEICMDHLEKVSRTFAHPIALFPEGLKLPIACSYLLCRIADTIEDHPTLSLDEKEQLFRIYLDVLEQKASPSDYSSLFCRLESGDLADYQLSKELPIVFSLLQSFPAQVAGVCRKWTAELTRGMNIYCHREPGADGIRALIDFADLDRYCYFVAGTVGQLIVELIGLEVPEAMTPKMKKLGSQFGTALQLVNILKDVNGDLSRSVSYLPRSLLDENKIELKKMHDPEQRILLKTALDPIFEMAFDHLKNAALPFVTEIPYSYLGIRLGCLLPLWLAGPTLQLLHNDPDYLNPNKVVKLSRTQVFFLIEQASYVASSNEDLWREFSRLNFNSPAPAKRHNFEPIVGEFAQ